MYYFFPKEITKYFHVYPFTENEAQHANKLYYGSAQHIVKIISNWLQSKDGKENHRAFPPVDSFFLILYQANNFVRYRE